MSDWDSGNMIVALAEPLNVCLYHWMFNNPCSLCCAGHFPAGMTC